MPMRIDLDDHNPSHEYHPGDRISGTVYVSFQKQQTISDAQIYFRGKLEAEYWQNRGAVSAPMRDNRKETIRLVELKQTLFTGPYDVQPQSFEWPFVFTIPQYVDCRRTGDTLRGFIEGGLSLLPPSFSWDSKSFSRDARACIRYKLVATIDSGDIFKNHKLELPILITRLSISPDPPLPPQMSAYEYLPSPRWSSRALRAQGHTLKQKFRHITSNDPALQTPYISFRAYIHFPASLSPQQYSPAAFSITPLRITPNDPEAPTLLLTDLSFVLKSHTAMVVSWSSSQDRVAEDQQYEASSSIRFEDGVTLPLDGAEVLLRDDICLSQWRPGRCWIGNFCTYTVMRDYFMKVEAKIQHADTGHVFPLITEFPFCVLDLHPGEMYEPQPPDRQDGLESGHHWRGNAELGLEYLPRYDEDVMPPSHDEEWARVQ